MNWTHNFALTASHQWGSILPEICLVVLAMSLLLIDVLGGRRIDRGLVARVAMTGQLLLVLVSLIALFGNEGRLDRETFSGMLLHSQFGQIMRFFFLASSVLVTYLGGIFLKKNPLPGTEFHAIWLLVTAGLMLLAQSNHFVMMFVALETVTVGFYVLVSYNRNLSNGLAAGLKYLILGGVSTAILLMGLALLYGIAESSGLEGSGGNALKFDELGTFLAFNSENLVARTGVLLVVAGIAFKIGTVPFQVWIPDVYQGAPTPVTAALAVSSKAGGFAVLVALVNGPFQPMADLLVPVLSAIAMATILFGNIAALTMRNVKRLMGLSGVSHAGYLLIGVVALFSIPEARNAIVFYLVTYLLAAFSVFGVMAHVSEGGRDDMQPIDAYQNLSRENPFLGGVLALGLASLAGIPPLAGFVGKFLLFYAAFKAQLYGLLGVAVIGVVLSIYYYFGWIREATFRFWKLPRLEEEPSPQPRVLPEIGLVGKITLGGLALLILLLGLYPGPLSSLSQY